MRSGAPHAGCPPPPLTLSPNTQAPLDGKRFRCLLCADYDLCETCFNGGHHPQHPFARRDTQTSAALPAEREPMMPIVTRLVTGLVTPVVVSAITPAPPLVSAPETMGLMEQRAVEVSAALLFTTTESTAGYEHQQQATASSAAMEHTVCPVGRDPVAGIAHQTVRRTSAAAAAARAAESRAAAAAASNRLDSMAGNEQLGGTGTAGRTPLVTAAPTAGSTGAVQHVLPPGLHGRRPGRRLPAASTNSAAEAALPPLPEALLGSPFAARGGLQLPHGARVRGLSPSHTPGVGSGVVSVGNRVHRGLALPRRVQSSPHVHQTRPLVDDDMMAVLEGRPLGRVGEALTPPSHGGAIGAGSRAGAVVERWQGLQGRRHMSVNGLALGSRGDDFDAAAAPAVPTQPSGPWHPLDSARGGGAPPLPSASQRTAGRPPRRPPLPLPTLPQRSPQLGGHQVLVPTPPILSTPRQPSMHLDGRPVAPLPPSERGDGGGSDGLVHGMLAAAETLPLSGAPRVARLTSPSPSDQPLQPLRSAFGSCRPASVASPNPLSQQALRRLHSLGLQQRPLGFELLGSQLGGGTQPVPMVVADDLLVAGDATQHPVIGAPNHVPLGNELLHYRGEWQEIDPFHVDRSDDRTNPYCRCSSQR